MHSIKFGRRKLSISGGQTKIVSTSITVRALEGENEQMFTNRLIEMCGEKPGEIEIVYKSGRPDYAILTFS